MLSIRALHLLRQYLKVSLRLRVPAGSTIDLSRSRSSRQLKTNIVGRYHLISWTPLSSKISLYTSTPYTRIFTHHPPNSTRSPSLCTLWGKSLCVEAGSECKPLLRCNRTLQQVVWSCIGPEKPFFFFFFTWITTSAERVRQQTLFVEFSVCLLLFFPFSFFILTLSN